jgi:4-hydroxybenzoate polyprenyltransferase
MENACAQSVFVVVFGMNDVYDYESDLVNPRKLASNLEGDVLPPDQHSTVRMAACASTIFIICISLITFNLQSFLSTALLVFLGWQYSAPPFRLKEIPVVDSLSNGAIVFLAWFIGYSSGRGKLRTLPDKGIILSLCTAGIHALGAVVDVESDIAAGQMTIATFFGSRTAAIFGIASL